MPSARLNAGQVYPTLERLQRDGWVEHDVVSQAERPDRKVYSLTEQLKGKISWRLGPGLIWDIQLPMN